MCEWDMYEVFEVVDLFIISFRCVDFWNYFWEDVLGYILKLFF